ncbi:MAG: alpha/beta hydrolase [Gammaproteobacteria bacterium]
MSCGMLLKMLYRLKKANNQYHQAVMPGSNRSFTTRDGVKIRYEVSGKGEPLLLIHGWTFNRHMWSEQIPDFQKHYKTITYDRRGCGESDGGSDLRLEAEDLRELLDHLQIDRTFLLGMSQGGRIALRFAYLYPERVKALILQCAPLDGYKPAIKSADQIPIQDYAQLVADGKIDAVRKQWLQHPLMAIPADKPDIAEKIKAIINCYSGSDLQCGINERMAFPVNLAENLDQIKAATLLIVGDKETDTLKDVTDKLLNGIRGSKKVVINGGGHLINLIKPALYNKAVLEFLAEQK